MERGFGESGGRGRQRTRPLERAQHHIGKARFSRRQRSLEDGEQRGEKENWEDEVAAGEDDMEGRLAQRIRVRTTERVPRKLSFLFFWLPSSNFPVVLVCFAFPGVNNS